MNCAQIELLGVRFDNCTTAEAADRIEQIIAARRPARILARNTFIRVLEERNPRLRRVYAQSELVTVDGMGFVYLGRFLGRPFREMTGGPGLWFEVLHRAAIRGYGVFLLGARPEVLESAAARLRERYPGLRIAGCHHGYFAARDEPAVVAAIRGSSPDILLVGMSSPQKEFFLERNAGSLGVPACIGVGGAIDLFAGAVRLAPRWMRAACLEWLYRVWQEPRRLFWRYLASHLRFLVLVARELAQRIETQARQARELHTR
jgi:N-acetylglucosaminyldiphosphoundecaprenol N-acetyl-beta-D-mannosaminyltransferase